MLETPSVAITKSSRHQKIIGDFGEQMVMNWLSRSGYEVVRVDHTGIDVIAYEPRSGRRLGISVKSRTRMSGTDNSAVSLFSYGGKKDAEKRQHLLKACRAFGCEPWIAVYVECESKADLYLTRLQHYDMNYRREGRKVEVWAMSSKARQQYACDGAVMHVGIVFTPENWIAVTKVP
ncbi:MAG TPA: hypothetical protein VM431_16060 [Phycisphaerae bacterium]|nr:hypothetical protein [Phycisphaerae bacterium]